MAGAIAMLIIMVFSSLSSCSVMMDGAMSAVLGTSYTSEDPDIIQTEANYTALETALQNELANIERTHPGYDEYRYDVDSIGHNPNELISYLTAKFDAFTPAQVQAEMETMFDRQYSLTTREVVEIRTRTVAEMFFQEHAMLVAYSMYLIGLLVAILVAAVIHLIDRRKSENYLLIELPEYKIPSSRTVAIYVWEKVKDYLTKAGTTIFVASILMWVILNFGPQGYTTEMADSFGAILGHFLVPFFAPIGLGFWQIAVALIAGISAKEVVVSSCAVLFGVPNINSGAGMDTLVGILSASGFGQLNAFCLMVFCLLYIPCAAALATIRKESGSTRWMLLSALFQLIVAWVVTFIVYRIGLFI